MKHNRFFILFISVLLTATACNNSGQSAEETAPKKDSNTTVNQLVFDKLLGTWQSEDGENFERWSKNDNGTYQSVVFSVKGSDTTWKERGNIYPENKNWVFENLVTGQNDGTAIKFTSSMMNDSSVQFSNPAHDFPTDINYTVADANTVRAFIAGPNDKGGKDTIPFTYARKKE